MKILVWHLRPQLWEIWPLPDKTTENIIQENWGGKLRLDSDDPRGINNINPSPLVAIPFMYLLKIRSSSHAVTINVILDAG